MAGRRALPYSAEAEDRLAPRVGRHKVLWRDRPKHFPSLGDAMTFAAQRAQTTQRRQRVRLEVAGGHCWTVRPSLGQVILMRPPSGTSAAAAKQLRDALDRMERRA